MGPTWGLTDKMAIMSTWQTKNKSTVILTVRLWDWALSTVILTVRLTKLPKRPSVFSLAPIFSKLPGRQIPDLPLRDHGTQLQAKN